MGRLLLNILIAFITLFSLYIVEGLIMFTVFEMEISDDNVILLFYIYLASLVVFLFGILFTLIQRFNQAYGNA